MWKKEFLSKAALIFSSEEKISADKTQQEALLDKLYAQIGQQKVEIDWLKKKTTLKTLEARRSMIEKGIEISLCRQCELLRIHRSCLYYAPVPESEENLHLMRLIDEQYYKTPFYGVRRITAWLRQMGHMVNRKRIKRLMELIGWQTIYRKRNTSKKDKQNPVYPYLLKDLVIDHPNQVWATDITYVPMRRGFIYLCAVIDVHTRFVVNWCLSNTMTSAWCRSVVEQAIETYGQPEIINSDQSRPVRTI